MEGPPTTIPDPSESAPDREGRAIAGAPPLRRRWAGRPGVAGRLLIAVLLPITILAIAASALLRERYNTAQQANSVANDIPALNGLVRLRSVLDQERIPVEATLRTAEFGINLPNAATFYGFQNETEPQARAALYVQLRVLGSAAPPGFSTRLAALLRTIDAGHIDATTVDHDFGALSDLASAAFAQRLAVLEQRTANISQAAGLNRVLTALSDANDALGAGGAETGELSDVYLAPAGRRSDELSALGGQMALFQRAGARLRNDVAPISTAFLRLDADREWRHYQSTVALAATGAGPPSSGGVPTTALPPGFANLTSLLPLANLFHSGLDGLDQIYHLVALAELNARQSAARLQASSASAFRTLVIETIIAVGLTIAVALLLARSISQPLRRLEGHARAVSSGDLELPPLPGRGPKETVVVSETFNDLVSNLRLLEAKTRALAECSFEDPVLAQPLPGRLGQALHESVAVLSGSIVERDSLQQRLVHQATHDALTALHNRAAAIEFLDQALARASRSSEAVAVLFVDLDDFKRANDTHGHAVGDAILKQIAHRMHDAARRGDFLARLGGDEFVVIAEGVNDGAEATAIAERLVHAAGEPVDVGEVRVSVGACVGIAFALDGAADDPSQLLARADLAVYRAKHAGHSRVEIYDESMQNALIARAQIEQDLHTALDHGGTGLLLQYQPVIDAASGRLTSVEALVRWDRPGHGRCQPNDFIPAAEASDLIIRLDRWVLDAALAQQRQWNRSGPDQISIAVNISGRHLLSGQLTEHVTTALASSGVAPNRLILELTETVLLADLPAVAVEMERLRGLGVRVAIDDFGTGYTSLAHLQHLTVDEIKIDRSFIQQLPGGRDSSLVRMVTELGHHLGVSIVAEGVETDDQLAALREVGCDSLQGFLIGHPLTVENLEAWQHERSSGDSQTLDETV